MFDRGKASIALQSGQTQLTSYNNKQPNKWIQLYSLDLDKSQVFPESTSDSSDILKPENIWKEEPHVVTDLDIPIPLKIQSPLVFCDSSNEPSKDVLEPDEPIPPDIMGCSQMSTRYIELTNTGLSS